METLSRTASEHVASATHAIREVEDQVKHTFDGLLHEGQERLSGAVDLLDHRLVDRGEGIVRDLTETAARTVGHLGEQVGLARQDLSESHGRLLDEAREEESRLRERRHRLRSAVEDVVQVLVGAVPTVGPYLSNLADRIDMAD